MRGPERGKASKEEGVTFLSEPESEQKGGGGQTLQVDRKVWCGGKHCKWVGRWGSSFQN